MGTLDGQVAFITGGARGQGRSHAVALARAGADIVVCDRCADTPTVGYALATTADLDETVELVKAEGRRCLSGILDVADLGAVQDLVAQALDAFGRIDILLANAGVSLSSGIQDATEEEWAEVIGTNLTGVFNAMHAVAPTMIAQRYGRIVATSSMMGRKGSPGLVAYSASKWGVIGLTKSAAQDLAYHGITVNALAPGNIATPMVQNETLYKTLRPDLEHPTGEDVKKILRSLHVQPIDVIPVEEVTNVVMFLVQPGNGHITGAVMDINAGASSTFTG